jgi:hypothetical protein
MRWAGALPSIKNVRGRSPRPIWVITSSTCRHGAIHLRQTMKAIGPNAPQIRIMMSQDTVFLFSARLRCVAKRCAKATRGRVRTPKALRKQTALVDFVRSALECGASSHRFRTHVIILRGADTRNRAQFQSRRRLCRVFRAIDARACRRCGCRSRFRSPRRR